LIFCTVLCLCSCGLIRNPIAEEYGRESYIRVENKCPDKAAAVSVAACAEGITFSATDITDKASNTTAQTFRVRKEDFLKSDDKKSFGLSEETLKSYSASFSVIQTDGGEIDVEKSEFQLEFGADYQFELSYENGAYVIGQVDIAAGERS